MAVHLHGLPADIEGINAVAERHGIKVIEDFSQAFGAAIEGRAVGGLGTVGVASLMAGKNLPSAGEGGILVTNDREIRNQAVTLKCFGEKINPNGSYVLSHSTMGWNYRINLLSAVMASQQLFHLDQYNESRRDGAKVLEAILNELDLFHPPKIPEGMTPVYHMYRFRIDPEKAGLSISLDQAREALKQVFMAEGLPLVEFQNQPLAGHDLMQQRVGYGRGCPWSCQNRENMTYSIEDYPGALSAIQDSLVLGYPAQAAIANPEVVDAYAHCFRKVAANSRAFERFARDLPAQAPPWNKPARLF